jgi:hypothetical protein
VVIKITDMSQDMQKEVIDFSRRGIDQAKTMKEIASYIKVYKSNFRTSANITIMGLGTASWEGTSARLSPMSLNIISTFISAKLPFCFLKRVEIHFRTNIFTFLFII